LKVRSVSPPLMHGHPATIMCSWQSLCIMSPRLDNLVGFNYRGNNISVFLTNLTSLEELLINFHELEGKHSGANMAEAVWETLMCFGIENQV
jgi:hypothetical protein